MAETCIPFLDKTCSGTRPYKQTTNDYECINSSNQHSIQKCGFGRVKKEEKKHVKIYNVYFKRKQKLTSEVEEHARKRTGLP